MGRWKRRRKRRGLGVRQRASHGLEERVERVGARHFGILAVDSSKKRFCVLLTDFYRTELSEMLVVENTRSALEGLVETVKALCTQHGRKDLVVAIERTGRYHVPVRDVLRTHWTVRMVHPFATKQLRQPASRGIKTDLEDLRAIVRAIVVGYGTVEPELPGPWADWRQVHRERADLVRQRARVRVQARERIEALLPGYGALFDDFWGAPVALALAAHYGSPEAIVTAGQEGIVAWLHQSGRVAWRRSVARVLQWAHDASVPEANATVRHRLLGDQVDHLAWLDARIAAYEHDLGTSLADTPFVVLLSFPGINVVSAAAYGAELGPIEHYPAPTKITGRAGLYPCRYQSDEVDHADGPLVGGRNARLRQAILTLAHNLLRCNEHVRAWGHQRKLRDWPAKKIHVAVANKFVRISYPMVAAGAVFNHPSLGPRDAILRKLVGFARTHGLEPEAVRDLLERAMGQLPQAVAEDEARALAERVRRRRSGTRTRRSGPVLLGDVLREIIAHLAPGLDLDPERSTPRHSEPPRTPH